MHIDNCLAFPITHHSGHASLFMPNGDVQGIPTTISVKGSPVSTTSLSERKWNKENTDYLEPIFFDPLKVTLPLQRPYDEVPSWEERLEEEPPVRGDEPMPDNSSQCDHFFPSSWDLSTQFQTSCRLSNGTWDPGQNPQEALARLDYFRSRMPGSQLLEALKEVDTKHSFAQLLKNPKLSVAAGELLELSIPQLQGLNKRQVVDALTLYANCQDRFLAARLRMLLHSFKERDLSSLGIPQWSKLGLVLSRSLLVNDTEATPTQLKADRDVIAKLLGLTPALTRFVKSLYVPCTVNLKLGLSIIETCTHLKVWQYQTEHPSDYQKSLEFFDKLYLALMQHEITQDDQFVEEPVFTCMEHLSLLYCFVELKLGIPQLKIDKVMLIDLGRRYSMTDWQRGAEAVFLAELPQ